MNDEDLHLAWRVVNPKCEPRVNRKSLLDAVHFSGRNPSRKEIQAKGELHVAYEPEILRIVPEQILFV